jgi:hypothetical protein
MLSKERRALGLFAGGVVLCTALVWIGSRYPEFFLAASGGDSEAVFDKKQHDAPTLHPAKELLKLVMAGFMGMLITAVHKQFHRDRPMTRSMEHAQILLCVSGALIMIIIGNSIARAFGIAGAAGIVRFRTAVDDPKDSILLFLLIGLGMACGLGSFGVAGLGTAFLCLFLFLLDRVGEQKPRSFVLALASAGSEFPTEHVQNLFNAYGIVYEPREDSKSDPRRRPRNSSSWRPQSGARASSP